MKRLLLFLLILFLPLAAAEPLWSFRLDVGCTECVEGDSVNTSLIIENQGTEEMHITQVYIFDSDNVAFFSSPLETTINPEKQLEINFNLLLPPPTRGSTLFYTPCLNINGEIKCPDYFTRMVVKEMEEEKNNLPLWILSGICLLILMAVLFFGIKKSSPF